MADPQTPAGHVPQPPVDPTVLGPDGHPLTADPAAPAGPGAAATAANAVNTAAGVAATGGMVARGLRWVKENTIDRMRGNETADPAADPAMSASAPPPPAPAAPTPPAAGQASGFQRATQQVGDFLNQGRIGDRSGATLANLATTGGGVAVMVNARNRKNGFVRGAQTLAGAVLTGASVVAAFQGHSNVGTAASSWASRISASRSTGGPSIS